MVEFRGAIGTNYQNPTRVSHPRNFKFFDFLVITYDSDYQSRWLTPWLKARSQFYNVRLHNISNLRKKTYYQENHSIFSKYSLKYSISIFHINFGVLTFISILDLVGNRWKGMKKNCRSAKKYLFSLFGRNWCIRAPACDTYK